MWDTVTREYLKLSTLTLHIILIEAIFYRKVNEAAKKQLDKLWHTTNIYLHPKIHEYAERLVATLPGNLKVGFFLFNSQHLSYLLFIFSLERLLCQQRI